MKRIYGLIVGLMLVAGMAMAQTTAPVLRIENGMHNAMINRASVDAAGRYLLTCSDDKTAQLWGAGTGELLRTLRIPIGESDEGKIYSCALSPDGRVAALGGWTGSETDHAKSIYLVNTQTGGLIDRIKGLPNVVKDIEFSPDGRWLAVGIGSTGGVYIFDAISHSRYKILSGYGDGVYNIAFDKDNQLATVSDDGKIRLYNRDFELIKQAVTQAGKQPYSVTFNPAGSLLAVGYDDAAAVEVRNVPDLSVAYKPDVAGTEKGGLDVLSFSADGRQLLGGGTYEKFENGSWKHALRIWDNAGKGGYRDIALTQKRIMDLKVLPNGNIAVAGSYPDIAVVTATGTQAWYQQAKNINLSAKDQSHFRISSDGAGIGFTPLRQSALTFDIPGRSLSEEESLFAAPVTSVLGAVVSEWSGSHSPSVNGAEISFMLQYEICRSADVSSDGKQIAFGTIWDVYLCSDKGVKIWEKSTPASAWAVNICGNDRAVAAALGDGTIRWYSMKDGKELLAFYLDSDKKRWVLFTPQGYYDASPGAEDFLGWHVNNGGDKAPSFYPVSRFRDQYYRPDVIDVILETYDEDAAIALANERSPKKVHNEVDIVAKLPPTVNITGPVNGSTVSSTSVVINYSLDMPADAPVKNVKVLADGRPVAANRLLVATPGNNHSISITIPPADCVVTLLAENDNGISAPADLHLRYAGRPAAPVAVLAKPKLYLLAVGISRYAQPDYELKYAHADATSIAEVLTAQKGLLYDDVVIKLLTDKDATREHMQDGLQWIEEQITQRDIAVIFYAGHGANDNNGVFYMLPVGADAARLKSTCLNFEDLKQTVSNIAGRVAVFVDACHSGNVMGKRRGELQADINVVVNELANTSNGAVTFTSCTGRESSLENDEWKHGAFTLALVEGLSGKGCVAGTRKITVKSLDVYVTERVKELTGGRQHPTSVIPPNVPDFAIGMVR